MKKRGLALIMSAAMMFSALTAFGPGSFVKAQNISKSQQIMTNLQRLSGGKLRLDMRQSNELRLTFRGGCQEGKSFGKLCTFFP